MEKPIIHSGRIRKTLLVISAIISLLYISWWLIPGKAGNAVLYYLLFAGEIYHISMAFLFWFTLWPKKTEYTAERIKNNYLPKIDVFITVAGEPVEIVKKTVQALLDMNYSNHTVYILNDGYVAGKDNWREIEELSKQINVHCITRKLAHGAKAGNINNALKQTRGELVAIFDADMVPHPDFLEKTYFYFENKKVGFVQTPQYYNNADKNLVTRGAWDQQEYFFGPLLQGKDNTNSTFICGTNVVIRRKALLEVGGMYEKSIAEDFLTSIFIHQQGWVSHYVPEVLVEGLAPQDLLAYYKQQLRWSRGSMQVLFQENPLLKKGLTWQQKLQYLFSSLFYFNGVIVLIDMVMPILFLFFGIQVVSSSTTSFALFFMPFMTLTLLTLYLSSSKIITFKAISFTHASWFLQLVALKSILLGENMQFSVTPKQIQKGNFIFLAYPHILYILLVIIGTFVAIAREGISPAVITNIAWAAFNAYLFLPFIQAAYPWKSLNIENISLEQAPQNETL